MYQYSYTDQKLVDDRVVQFRDQTSRYLEGKLDEEQFRPLRLMNGLYIQRQAPMLRVAIPYGELNSSQLRMLAAVSREFDRGYGHFTTRQNIQFNWLRLEEVPDLLAKLATVQMHAIQTSGNCIRNITSDELAGINSEEVEDPRPWCEIIRQWASLHPEFIYLPRKFKIAVTGSQSDRAVTLAHDIGLQLVKNCDDEIGFRVIVGGGLGRTPIVGKVITDFLPKVHLLTYLESILRLYNLKGRRDNKYKARIKILVKSMGIEAFRFEVEKIYKEIKDGSLTLNDTDIEAVKKRFRSSFPTSVSKTRDRLKSVQDIQFILWKKQNTVASKFPNYSSVFVSLKKLDVAPGDITALEMDTLAELADKYSSGILRTTHRQNLLFPLVHNQDLAELWGQLKKIDNAGPNIGTVQDIICCPGIEFCSLANTTSIPIALEIQQRFSQPDEIRALGDIQIKISGCMNACGHHHVGHIGILGVDKKGEEWFQITLGGRADQHLKIGKRLGPAVDRDSIVNTVELIIRHYLRNRLDDREHFLATLERIGIDSFKVIIYG